MGYVGQAGHHEVVAVIENAIGKISKSGKAACILALEPEQARHYIDKGAGFVAVGVDTLLLRNSARALLQKLKTCSQE